MSKYLLLGLLVAGIAVGTYVGCGGARVGVAKDAAIKKIDELLGPLNVKQKKVELALAELKEASERIRSGRFDAAGRLKQLNEKKAGYVERKTKLMDDLKKLSDMLSNLNSDGMFEPPGKAPIPVAKLQDVADQTMAQVKSLNEKIANDEMVIKVWTKNFELLKKDDDTSTAQLEKLDSQLELIKGKKLTLDSLRQATLLAPAGESVSDKFNDLTDSVDELMREVDTGLAFEESKIDDRVAEIEKNSMTTLEDLLDDGSEPVSDTTSAIQKMLDENAGK